MYVCTERKYDPLLTPSHLLRSASTQSGSNLLHHALRVSSGDDVLKNVITYGGRALACAYEVTGMR